MRAADLAPTPGNLRSAWVRPSRALESAIQGAACPNVRGQNGNFMPPGRPGMPAVSLPIFSWLTSSALRTAALKAAATRSSSMSLSSAKRLGSISMRLTSCLQVMVTLTRPAPASAVTSTNASSSCAFFRLSCIACACFMRPASCPLLNMFVSLNFGFKNWWQSYRLGGQRLDAAGDNFGTPIANHVLHKRVAVNQLFSDPLALDLRGSVAPCRGVVDRAYFHGQPEGGIAQRGLQSGLQLLAGGGLAQRLALHTQGPQAIGLAAQL